MFESFELVLFYVESVYKDGSNGDSKCLVKFWFGCEIINDLSWCRVVMRFWYFIRIFFLLRLIILLLFLVFGG